MVSLFAWLCGKSRFTFALRAAAHVAAAYQLSMPTQQPWFWLRFAVAVAIATYHGQNQGRCRFIFYSLVHTTSEMELGYRVLNKFFW